MQITICMRMNFAFLKCSVVQFCTLYSRNLVALLEGTVPLIQTTVIGRGEDQKSPCPLRDSNPSYPVVLQTVPCSPESPNFQDPNCYWPSLSAHWSIQRPPRLRFSNQKFVSISYISVFTMDISWFSGFWLVQQLIAPCVKIPVEKLRVARLVAELPPFCGTCRFVTVLTGVCHWPYPETDE